MIVAKRHRCRSRHQNILSIFDKYDKHRLTAFNVEHSVNRMQRAVHICCKREKREKVKEPCNNDADLSASNAAEGEPGFRWPCTRI